MHLQHLTVTYGPVFGYYYDGGIGFNLYNPFTNATHPLSYEKEEHIYFKKKSMQEYQIGKSLVNSWDDSELVTIQTRPSLDIVQVEPKYVTNINPEPHNHTIISVVPHYSWVQHDIKVTLKLHDMPIPKQVFLIYDDDKCSLCQGRGKKTGNKDALLPLNDFINVATNLIDSKQLLQGWVSVKNIYKLQELYSASTPVVCQIILTNSANPADISDFSIGHLLQEDTLAFTNYITAIDLSYTTPPKSLNSHHELPVKEKSIWYIAFEEELYGIHNKTKTWTYISKE